MGAGVACPRLCIFLYLVQYMQFFRYRAAKAVSFIPALIFVLILAVGLASAALIYKSNREQADLALMAEARSVAARLQARFEQHIALLRASKAFFEVSAKGIDENDFASFMARLSLDTIFPSAQGIGFAPFIFKDTNPELMKAIWPVSDEPFSVPVRVLAPADARNIAALNYDMYSDLSRRAAINHALETGELSMTAPVILKQEITEDVQPGVLAYFPLLELEDLYSPDSHQGFVYAAYRTVDLHKEVIGKDISQSILIRTYDVAAPAMPLFESKNFVSESDPYLSPGTATLTIGGREWIVEARHRQASWYERPETDCLLVGLFSLLIASLVSSLTYQQFQYVRQAQENRALVQKNLKLKELHFREMKHRLKNSIARILAIARQTEVSTNAPAEFNKIFFDRLNAMAQAQDMFDLSNEDTLSLEALIGKELKQATSGKEVARSISGETVLVGPDHAANMGLIFHELATNALKYGCFATDGGRLAVHWEQRADQLQISWVEEKPEALDSDISSGFGTVLINSLVQSELGGDIQRQVHGNQFKIEITVPLTKPKGSDHYFI